MSSLSDSQSSTLDCQSSTSDSEMFSKQTVSDNSSVPSFSVITAPSLPWGGGVVPWGGEAILTNTCPIDNLLTFVHLLFLMRTNVLTYFKQCSLNYARLVVSAHDYLLNKAWKAAKVSWLQTLGIKPNYYYYYYYYFITCLRAFWRLINILARDSGTSTPSSLLLFQLNNRLFLQKRFGLECPSSVRLAR